MQFFNDKWLSEINKYASIKSAMDEIESDSKINLYNQIKTNVIERDIDDHCDGARLTPFGTKFQKEDVA